MSDIIFKRPPCASCGRPALMVIADCFMCGDCVVKLEKLQRNKTKQMITEELNGSNTPKNETED